MKKILLLTLVLGVSTAAFGQKVSALYEEFLRRESAPLTLEQVNAINFLKNLKEPYNVQGILELDILEPDTTFVFRDRNGDICFGDSEKSLLRCKNEMGIATTLFDGDND